GRLSGAGAGDGEDGSDARPAVRAGEHGGAHAVALRRRRRPERHPPDIELFWLVLAAGEGVRSDHGSLPPWSEARRLQGPAEHARASGRGGRRAFPGWTAEGDDRA